MRTASLHKKKTAYIRGNHIFLRKLCLEDASEEYLRWINDPVVLRFRSPKVYPSSMEDLTAYIKHTQNSLDLYLAIFVNDEDKHIGGISLTSVNYIHRTAELNIMIGDKNYWGKKLGTEAVYLTSRHAFLSMNLHKLCAQSPNPTFNKIVKGLDWVHEGTKREMFLLEEAYVDLECYGILRSEFQPRKEYESSPSTES